MEHGGLFPGLSARLAGTLKDMGLAEPTPPQVEGIPAMLRGEHVLLIAPTGTGKTEAALLPILDGLLRLGSRREGISVLYITPLRALNRDMERRLERWGDLLDFRVAVRHGDTSTRDRRRQAVKPPDLLVTTPETLQAILPGKVMRRHLSHVRWVVVDEVHELAEDRRGVQLSIALERLEELAPGFQRIGLSATVGNPREVAAFLAGRGRPVTVVEVSLEKAFTYTVELPTPVPDDYEVARNLYVSPEAAASLNRIEEWLDNHRSALIFVNSRGVAEVLGSRLNMLRQDVGVHHGSLPREERARAENRFKAGELKALVCIAADEPIVTAKGVKHANNVELGDRILSFDPQSRNTIFGSVTRKFTRVSSNLLHIKHELGLLRVTPNHPVLCLSPQGFAWKLAQDLKVGDALVTAGRVEGNSIPTHSLINYPNLFVKNTALRALGWVPPKLYRKRCVTRFLALKSALNGSDLLKLAEFSTTQTSYTFPPWVDPRLGYLLGFPKSDGDRHMRFFNTDPRKIGQVESFLSEIYHGQMRKTIAPIGGFGGKKPLIVLEAHSKVLSNVFTNLWETLPLKEEVVAAFLAAYLDGDGCISTKENGRIEQIQFVTFNAINREYLLFCLRNLGFKPKLWKANGASGEGFCISVVYSDDKSRLLKLIKGFSIKAAQAKNPNFGRKPQTYYGLGPFLRHLRKNQGVSSYRLWQIMNYSTKYETPTRGITIDTLRQLNQYLDSPIIDDLLSGRFGISQVSSLKEIDGDVDVVNFEVKDTQAYAVTGVITHNCTSTLELGIDIGSVDLVLQYMSPRQVSGLIQRVGRSGHALGRTSRGVIIATSVDDTLEAVAVALRAQRGLLEPLKIHRGALDVLGHQVMGMALDRGGRVEESTVQATMARADPYADLPGESLRKVTDFFLELRLMRREDGQLIATGRGRDYYYQNLSMIRDERRYPAIDLTTQHVVGILGDEFMMLRARQGVNFLVKGKAWKIERIGGDGSVYVTPVENPLAILPGWDGEMLPVPFDLALEVASLRRLADEALDRASPEVVAQDLGRRWPGNPWAVRRVVEEIAAHRAAGAPVPTDRRLLVEAFGRYLIIHAPFGEVVNEALGDLIEDNLARDHLVRFWWADAQRILVELTVDTSDLELSPLVRRVLYLSPAEVEAGLRELLQEHIPLGFYMKFIAERFGALPRGKWWSADEVNSFPLRFKGSPVEEEALREVNLLHLDPPSVREAFRRIREGEMEVKIHWSLERPTPLGYPILRRFIEAPELFAPDATSDANLERMKNSLEVELVSLLCLDCGEVRRDQEIRALGERPECLRCHSRLLGILPFSHAHLVSAYDRKRRREKLEEDEAKAVARVRQSADLVLSHGKRAVVAQAVYGIGPQTAAKILARMHDDEKEFYRDLLEAKLRFITNRSYWNR